MNRLESGFSLTALLDGTTLNVFLRVEGLPLVQRYLKDTKAAPIPDFESTTLKPEEHPTLVAIVRSVADGEFLNPSKVTWKYNTTVLHFDASGLSTDEGLVGVFQKLDNHLTDIGGRNYPCPALRVMKNLVVVGDYDNDRISVSGEVEVMGNNMTFAETTKEVIIQESTGNAYAVVISDNKGGGLVEYNENLTCEAKLYQNNVEVNDLTGITFQWVKMLGDGEVNWGTSRTQIVNTSDVNNKLYLRCDVKKNGSLLASGFTQITDFSDPEYVDFQITGIQGNVVKRGETAIVTPIVRKRDSGELVEGYNEWSFSIKDNAGNPFSLSGEQPTFTAAQAAVSFADMTKAGYGISGIVSTTKK